MADEQFFLYSEVGVPPEDNSANESKSSHRFQELNAHQPQLTTPVKDGGGSLGTLAWAARYFLTIFAVGAALAAPIVIFHNDLVNIDTDTTDGSTLTQAAEDKQYLNLIFYLFSWFLATWMGGCIADIFILAFPFLFRFIAGYVNPAHQRYWRIFRALRMPVTLLGCCIASYVSFALLIDGNDLLLVDVINKDPNSWGWDDTINDVLQQTVFWVVGYLLEKMLILYISVHYHYRSDQVKNKHSKEMREALAALYETSINLHPFNNTPAFVVEDSIIRNAFGSESDNGMRQGASQFLRKIGIEGHRLTQFVGDLKRNKSNHWLQADSPYAVVERCLSHPRAAAALAKRIWMSLVVQGNETFSAEDIAEVLGPYRREEAMQIFEVIDENESGDIRLDEMVWTVVEAGRIRRAIYQNMTDINHCINTFDWITLFMLAAVMIFFILVAYVPTIQKIQQTASFLVLGLAVAIGNIFVKYVMGCVYCFFYNVASIGDVVIIYNTAGGNPVKARVMRQSILYTVFNRIDDGTDLQIANDQLAQEPMENLTRSGVNKQAFTICVDFKTSFQDLMFLRGELESFLKQHRRDYQPELGLSIVCVHELNKLELAVAFTHKSNWSNERLRAVRSSRFMCALLVAVRKIPIYKPGGSSPGAGDPAKPNYTVQISDDEAKANEAAEKQRRAAARIDAVPVAAAEPDVDPAADADADDVPVVDEAKERAAAERAAEEEALMSLARIPAVEPPMHTEAEAISAGVDTLLQAGSTGLRARLVVGTARMFY